MEFVFVSLLIGFVMGFVVMAIAESKGYKHSFGWFFYGLMIWPVALIHSLILEKKEKHQEGGKQEGPYKELTKEKESSIIILPEHDLLVGRKERENMERERIARMEAKRIVDLEKEKKVEMKYKEGEIVGLVISGVIVFMTLVFMLF